MEREKLLGTTFRCECGAEHRVPIKLALIESGALEKASHVLRQLGLKGRVFLLADATTFEVAGRRLETILSKAGSRVHLHVLANHPHADDVTAEAVAASLAGDEDVVVSCGSGTITDLGKYAAHARHLPFVAVATAPSMNGYASGIVALTKNGLKTTGTVTPAQAVIADIDILANAPLPMIRAGLGDLLSKGVCNADWKLSSLVTGEHFCSKPFELIRDVEKIYSDRAELLPKRDRTTIKALAEAIVYSGVSMVMAGSSSPASGGEHLISHFLDMAAPIEKRVPDFHGAQVGVGTIATAMLYEKLFALSERQFDEQSFASASLRAREAFARCRAFFGSAVPGLEQEFEHKWREGERSAKMLRERWNDIRKLVSPFLTPSERFRTILRAAGAKTTYRELGVSHDQFRAALTLSFCIRRRYTILDVGLTAGLLDAWAEEVLTR